MKLTKYLLVAIGAVTLFFFQNCGKAGFENQDIASTDGSALSSDPKLAGLPFPYDLSFNQLSYMSCPNTTGQSPGSPYFTFHLGAYDNAGTPADSLNIRTSGVSLNASFLSQFHEAVKNSSSDQVQAQLKHVLMNLPSAQNKQIHISVRKANNTKTEAYALSGFPIESQQNLLLGPLSGDIYAQTFAQNESRVFNFFSGFQDIKSSALNGAINFPIPASMVGQSQFRTDLLTRYLVAGFVDPSVSESNLGPAPIGPDESNKNKIYGHGYQMSFGQYVIPANFPNYPLRVLSNVFERNLETGGAAGGTWDCRFKFKIVKPDDRNKLFWYSNNGTPAQAMICPSETWEQLNRPVNLAVLHLLRRVLPAEWWDVNTTYGCVVPKAGINACYDASSTQPVVYDEYFFPTNQADPAQGKYSSCGEEGQYPCSHYLTICVRH